MRKFLILSLFFCGCSAPQVLVQHNDFGAKRTLAEMYQQGISQRELGKADECLATFSNLIELRKQVKDSLYVYSLFQSGLCLEMKNQLDKAIAVYQDALRAKGVVPADFYQLEVPSRLAINYSKLGEQKVSDDYYQKSKVYLEKLLKNKSEIAAHKEHYAELLYQMGLITTDFKRGVDFASYMKSIQFSQEYLTLALELNVEPYSKYAAQQLLVHFQNTFDYISQLQPEQKTEDVIAQRENQQEKAHLSEILLQHMDQFYEFLKSKRQIKNAEYTPILSQLKTLQANLEKMIAQRPAGEGLTPEAQKLQDPKIEGKLLPVPGEDDSEGKK